MEWVVSLVYAGFLAGTGALAVIDVRTRLLPNRIVYPLFAFGVVGLTLASWLGHEWWRLIVAAAAAALCFGLFWLLWFFGGMGFGDVRLIGVIGLYLGWIGISAVEAGVLLGTLVASVYHIGKLLLGKASRKSELAFGPYLIGGAWAALALEAVLLAR
ncbi:prepilin peptidase [Actinospica sp. MGRD01-02]|uniref:Prepilin peptidase n=1 Tax=Actinospica acidithermotolerans TaxID=2828514 RepID=A0A941EBY9_9ACTN|nr:A24 family peptidase [Actinospica acidithermotolerans]MBR7828666.1 prepilin peptidase [Actinospica acidithermotolerans]